MEIQKVTIVGMGALGVMYGDFLGDKLGKDRVEFVADRARIDRYRAEGVYCNDRLCDFNYVDEAETGKPADLLLFAVKSTALDDAIETVRNKIYDDTIILSVLNGISSEEIIAKAYGEDKIIHCVAQGMDATKVGNRVTYSKFGQLCIGIPNDDHEIPASIKQKLQAVVDLFNKTGMPYTLEDDIVRRMWSKFMLNVGVNQAVMIYEGTYGTIQQPGKARDLMQDAMREVITLAQKENVKVGQDDFDEYVSLVDTLSPNGMPSMRQDGLARRKSEVELFAGTVLNLARKHKIDMPVNKMIYETVLKIENDY